jgi:hypothetical protein
MFAEVASGGWSILLGMTDLAASYGISLLGSFITGKAQKVLKGVPNDAIPLNNSTGWGIGVGTATGDPRQALAAMAGAITASYAHQLYRKIRGR